MFKRIALSAQARHGLFVFANLAVIVGIAACLSLSKAYAQQSSIRGALPPIVSLLLDDDPCISPAGIGYDAIIKVEPDCFVVESDDIYYTRFLSFRVVANATVTFTQARHFPLEDSPYLVLRQGTQRNSPTVPLNQVYNGSYVASQGMLSAGNYLLEISTNTEEVIAEFTVSIYGDRVTATSTGRLNDTTLVVRGKPEPSSSSDPDGIDTDCFLPGGSTVDPDQDCGQGRDASDIIGSDTSDGIAGLSLVRVAPDGSPLFLSDPDYAVDPWDCVKDNVTGLMWEVKQPRNDDVPRRALDRFTWYSTDSAINNGNAGVMDTNNACFGYMAGNPATYCNTSAYVDRVNQQGLCGYADWRAPAVAELNSIHVYGRQGETQIDENFFPNVENIVYWAGHSAVFVDGAVSNTNAWAVRLPDTDTRPFSKSASFGLRLVRDGK